MHRFYFLSAVQYRVYLLAEGARRRDGRAGGRGRGDPRGPLGPLGVGLPLG